MLEIYEANILIADCGLASPRAHGKVAEQGRDIRVASGTDAGGML